MSCLRSKMFDNEFYASFASLSESTILSNSIQPIQLISQTDKDRVDIIDYSYEIQNKRQQITKIS